MLVIDRSRSSEVSNSCDDLRAAAVGFVTKFAPGRDNLGLVTYGTSSFLEFPTGNNFATANPTLESRISSIVCTGGTASSDGLSRGYWNLAGLNQPAALNVILFFTDGQPTAITHQVTRQERQRLRERDPDGRVDGRLRNELAGLGSVESQRRLFAGHPLTRTWRRIRTVALTRRIGGTMSIILPIMLLRTVSIRGGIVFRMARGPTS
jgi:von Willebrand factor type A domain